VTDTVLACEGLIKRFGGIAAVDGVTLELRGGEIHALIGPNGAGKTTLLDLLSGELRPDRGRILLDGIEITHLPPHRRARAGIARSFQITAVFASFSVRDHVMLALQARQRSSFRFFADAGREPGLSRRAWELLARVGLGDEPDCGVERLSHGRKRQLELAMALAGEPRLLLLDEPLAGMSAEEGRAVVELLAAERGRFAMLLVEHDMDAVFRLADRITVLDRGRVIASGPPAVVRADPEVMRAYLGDEEAC